MLPPIKEKAALWLNRSWDRRVPVARGGLNISLILFLFSLPLAYITAVREITLGLAIFFWLMIMVLTRHFLWPRTPLDWPWLLWLILVFGSLVWAVNPAYSFRKIQGEVLKGVVVFYLLFYATQEPDNKKQILFTLIVGNLFMILYTLWDFWHQGGSFSDYTIRARGLHSSYPELGAYLITLLPFFLVSFFSPRIKPFRWFLGALIGLNLFGLYLTFGRAMWLAAAAEILIVFWLLRKRSLILIFVLGLMILSLALPKSVWFHGERLSLGGKISVQKIGGTGGDLIDIWKLAFKFILNRPFQGIGYGRHSFSEAFPSFRAAHQPLLWHAHNTFLNITFQTGIQGLLAFLWLIGAVLYYTYRRWKTSPGSWSGLLNAAVFTMVIGFFIRNCFDDLYVGDNLLLFWFLVGAALSPGRDDPETVT
jgi:O-antigen ligase